MTERFFDVVVVGAGVVGAAVGYELANAGVSTLVVEAETEPAAGASRSNSGIVHTGFDSKPGTLETSMIRDQAVRWKHVFDVLGIPYCIPGALLPATTSSEESAILELVENASRNGVKVEVLSAREVRRLEPNCPPEARGGLLVPGEAITDPFEVVRRLLATVPEVWLGWPVTRIERRGDGVLVRGPSESVTAGFAVNCAGLHADEIAGDGSFRIIPRRGEFLVFGKGTSSLVKHILLPVPSGRTKGVLVFPTLYGNLCAGPSAIDQEDKRDWRPRRDGLAFVRKRAGELVPLLKELEPVNAWAGLRPAGYPRNYIVEWSERVPAMLHVAGIRSTGLSSSLGLSRYVLERLVERGLSTRNAARRRTRRPDFSDTPRPWWERLNRFRGIQATCFWE